MADLQGGKVIWDLEIDSSKFDRGLDLARTKIGGIGKTATTQVSGVQKLNKSLVNLAGAYIGFEGLKMVGGFLADSIRKFNEAEESTAALTNTILNQKGATQANVDALMKQAEALSLVTTFSDDVIRTGQSQLATFDGMTSELVEQLTPAWLDFMTKEKGMIVTNEEAKQSAQGLGKAMVGSMDVLTRMGFRFTDAQKKVFEFGDTQDKVNIIIEGMKYASGAAADAASTFQGRMLILNNQMDKGKEAIGGVASVIRAEFINALVSGDGGMQGFGNNALQIAKQIGIAFAQMAEKVMQGMNGIITAARLAGAVIGKLENNKTRIEELSEVSQGAHNRQQDYDITVKAIRETNVEEAIKNKLIKERTDLLEQGRKDDELAISIIKGGNVSLSSLLADEFNAGVDRAARIAAAENNIQTTLTGLSDLNQLIKAKGGGGNVGGGPTQQNTDELKKQVKLAEQASEKALDFKNKQYDASQKIVEANKKQKESLDDLKKAYDETITRIQKSIEKLNISFTKSEESAKQSLLSNVASAAETAKKTIEERNQAILTEQNKGEGADQAVIAGLQALNARDQAILEANASLIAEGEKKVADAKTALGVQQVIEQYNQEKTERLAAYNEELSDLNKQLVDKETAYKLSNAKIMADTKETIAGITADYATMVESTIAELQKLGAQYVGLITIGAIKAPTLSDKTKELLANFSTITGKRALGGPVMPNNTYLVGERGPELFVPNTAGNIVPNGGGNVTMTFNVSEKVDLVSVMEEVGKYLSGKTLRASAGIS